MQTGKQLKTAVPRRPNLVAAEITGKQQDHPQAARSLAAVIDHHPDQHQLQQDRRRWSHARIEDLKRGQRRERPQHARDRDTG